jgi:hypothetical protein
MTDQLPLFDEEAPAPADPDTEAREFARDPGHNVVLEASAGTGKTSVLVTRYVNLLTRGVEPANILAITFTRKAAAEMRERIIRELRRAAEQSTFDRARWAAIRDRLADIQISTIDAFCLSLLREFPLEADLDPGFGMADETEVPRLVDQSLDSSLAIFIGLAKREPDLALVLAQLGLTRTREGLAYLLQRRLVAWDVLDRVLARGPANLDADAVCRRAVDELGDLLRGVAGGLETFLAEGPIHQPRYQLLAQDLRRLESFTTAGNASVRGLLNRVAAHVLKADGKPRTSDRIHPYRNEDYPSPAAGKRHRQEANRLGPPVESLLRRSAAISTSCSPAASARCSRSRWRSTRKRSTIDRCSISPTSCSMPSSCSGGWTSSRRAATASRGATTTCSWTSSRTPAASSGSWCRCW